MAVEDAWAKVIELVRPFFFMAFGGLAVWSYTLYQQSQSNNELLHNDSKHEQIINSETQELKDEIDEWLKHNDPVLSDGSDNPEWLRILERQRELARERGDQGSFIRKATNVFTP